MDASPHDSAPPELLLTAPAAPAVNRRRIAVVLGALIALGPLTIDLHLPSFPTIAAQLETTAAAVQLTLTGTLLGLAAGQLLVGPLSDALGRRRPLLMGTALHVLASLAITVAPNIAVLGALRVTQGLGAAAGSVIALAVVRDLFAGRAVAILLSRLFLIMGVAPVLAPSLGAELLRVISWRGVFAVLALYGLVLLFVVWRTLPETLPPSRRRNPGVRSTLRTCRSLLHDRPFVGLVLLAGLTWAAIFSYVAGVPFVYQGQFGLDQQEFGLWFGIGAVFLVAATQLNAILLRRLEPRAILATAIGMGTLASLVLLTLSTTGLGALLGVALPMWVVLFACGLILPNAPALALSRHGDSAGTAAALLGAVQFGIGALVSPLVGLLGNDASALGMSVAGAFVLASAVVLTVVRPWQLEDVKAEPAAR